MTKKNQKRYQTTCPSCMGSRLYVDHYSIQKLGTAKTTRMWLCDSCAADLEEFGYTINVIK